ncbi:hypothetical protein D9615_000462 [Tricholomella constricta]|uniref:Uncharacterized protein n=1 Tax=Tricholomella constricta TaxID=117010 RepID=A0A8H5HR97_9AGAR|nr:hypothetical protein D9615_000462 [Tricholomella constricta]
MQRGPSYRKPVPTYIPSPPASPMQLSHSLESDEVVPPLPVDWRAVIEQVSMRRRNSISTISDTARTYGQDPLPGRRLPSLKVESPDGEEVPIEISNYTPLHAPSILPPSPERHSKRKLHQHYRPPTPPLPTHTRKQRIDSSTVFLNSCEMACPSFNDAREITHPEPRRMPSMTAPSFSTTRTQSPSFKTETTYLSMGPSEVSILWSRNADDEHQGLSKPVGHTREFGRDIRENVPNFSWWGRIVRSSASLGTKLRRIPTTFIC